MDHAQMDRLIAATLAAGLVQRHKDALTGDAPNVFAAVQLYQQCLRVIRERQSQAPAEY